MPFDLPSSQPSRSSGSDKRQRSFEPNRQSRQQGQHRKRPSSDTFVMGWHPVLEALETGKEFQRVMIQRDEKGERTAALMQKLHALNIPVQRVPKEKLLRITAKNHQGIIAFLSPITYQPLEEVIARTFESGKTPLLVAVDGVTDVRNIGAIARSAECFGATALVIPMSGVAPIQEDAIKSSSGALMRLPVARVPDMAKAIKSIAQHGIQPVALSEKADDSIHDTTISGSVCLVVGDEELGISNAVFRNCSEGVRLPMVGNTGSLNVSVAAGIALSHIAMWKDREDTV
jgi:23S rRNA (guanosine2251-2'-O)-methyltransferase